jgi:DNA-binding NtrC family response regulator
VSQGIEILIVDDDKALLGVLRSVLEAQGHRVEAVPSAYEALPRLEQQRYDLVLVDLKMRRMNGLELLAHERLRERGTRMVIMTAYPTVESAVQAMRQGAFDYLVKPFKLAELRAIVARAARERVKVEPEQVAGAGLRQAEEDLAQSQGASTEGQAGAQGDC